MYQLVFGIENYFLRVVGLYMFPQFSVSSRLKLDWWRLFYLNYEIMLLICCIFPNYRSYLG